MKNIKNKILILALGTLFMGCSQSATSVFEKDPSYGQNMQYTKVVKVIDKKDVLALFNITYLNAAQQKKWDTDTQNFLIGSYSVDNNSSQYHLTMNGKEKLSSTPLTKEDPLFENIAFKNHWAEYAIVSFSQSDQKELELTYTYDHNKTLSTTFIKE